MIMEPCEKCNGTGVIETVEIDDNEDEESTFDMCVFCCGTGDANYDPICEDFDTED